MIGRSLALGSLLVLPVILAGCSRHSSSFVSPLSTPVTVAFETRTEIPTNGVRVADATLADLDGDGDLDLAVTALGGTLEVLLNNGAGQFAGTQSLPAPGFAFNVRAADVDADGDLDLVVLRTADQRVSVFLNTTGNGDFALASEEPVEPDADSLVVDDCTGDGIPDVLLSHFHPPVTGLSELTLLEGHGDGTFEPSRSITSMPAGTMPAGITVHDLDGDGHNEIIVADNAAGKVRVFACMTGGAQQIASYPVGASPVAVSAGDLDDDGIADLAVSNFGDGTVSILTAASGYSAVQTPTVHGPPGRSTIADVTGDGVPDLIVCTFEAARVSIFPGVPGAGVGSELQLAASGLPFQPVVGDVNGDGDNDLLVTASGLDLLNLWLGKGNGLGRSFNFDPGVSSPESVTVADLDGDQHAEIVVAGLGGNELAILGLPAGSNQLTSIRPHSAPIDVGLPVRLVDHADLDRDGRHDLLVATSAGVVVLINRTVLGSGNIVLDRVPPNSNGVVIPGAGVFGMAAADMDHDGILDVVASDAFLGTVSVARAVNRQLQFAPLGTPVVVGGQPGGLVVADFDGDGAPDVAVARNAAARVAFLRNDGNGNLQPWLEEPVGAGPNYLQVADFDGDHRPDLAVSDAGTDDVTVLRNTGGSFATQVLFAGARPTGLLADDINRDGNADLLSVALSSGDFRAILGNGDGTFEVPRRFPGTYKAVSAALGDVDGDGLDDLVVASTESQRVSLYRNVSAPLKP